MTHRCFGTHVCAILLVCLALSCSLLPAQSFQVGTLQVPPGQSVSGYLDVPAGPDGQTRIPVTVINGASRGPALAVIAGNHGYEYPPILASQRLAASISPKTLKGRVVIVHVANMPSFMKRTIYYSPVDGENLNRVYPGKADGSLSERIAWVITHQVIENTDYLVDLHCGDGNESLRTYGYWMPIGDPKVDEPARQLVLAFGLDHVVIDRSRPKDAGASLYCSNTAMTRGKPALTIESGGMGVSTDEEEIATIERGVNNLMRHLKMVTGKVEAPAVIHWYEPTEVVRFPENLAEKEGLFQARVKKAQMVQKDEVLGIITDLFGKQIYEVRAPFAGEIFYVIGTPPVSAGEPLAFVCAEKDGAEPTPR